MPNGEDSLPPSGHSLQRAFESLILIFQEQKIRYAIIGGLAVVQHARVRTTDDIDALVSVPQLAMPALFEALQAAGFKLDPIKNIKELRDHGMTFIEFDQVIIDLIGPILPAYARVLDRAQDAEIFGHAVRVCSPEGLIILKLIAFRPQDQLDVRDLISAYGTRLDTTHIDKELETVMPPDDPRRKQFETWLRSGLGA